jgi:NADPH-dependent curcumin reductase CurA
LGISGLIAYIGLYEVGRPRAGETVLISAAAGSVGLIVGQLAALRGCRVLGLTGAADKARRLVNEYGFSDAADYRSVTDLTGAIHAAAVARSPKRYCPFTTTSLESWSADK